MEAILLKNQIQHKIEQLTPQQLLLVSNFVGWVEKALPQTIQNTTTFKNKKNSTAKKPRNLHAILEIQKVFQEAGVTSLVQDAMLERDDRILLV